MALEDVRIHLDAFDGPLDLLLHLIRREEVEVTDIPIARITSQYLDTLTAAGVEHIDVETAGEFLVMAATLMEIKSRMLVPAAPGPADPAGGGEAGAAESEDAPGKDPRADLVRQLLAYKKYRDAAQALDQRHADWSRRFPGAGALVPERPEPVAEEEQAAVEFDELDLVDLAQAFASIMESVDLTRLGEHRVLDDETPTALHATDILDRLKRAAEECKGDAGGDGIRPEIEFRELFVGRTKSEAIGMFLAVLELVRQRQVEALQDRNDGRIVIRLREPDAAQSPTEPKPIE
ncbi:MAG: segregation/condensation protein A [Phycisphaerae bacterium]|nr:segregation/condensation protein A [Phycisphaerae bacterium]